MYYIQTISLDIPKQFGGGNLNVVIGIALIALAPAKQSLEQVSAAAA
jgi:hypothetical protein